MAEPSTASSEYYLPRNPTESERLNQQHKLIKTAFSEQLTPTNLKLPQELAIFDSATGTGTFLKDFISTHPDVHFTKAVGCDISPDQFPPESARKVAGIDIDLRVHNILEPVPAEWQDSFDLVNQRLLVAGLKESQWPTALENLSSLLKPGGYLNIVEVLLRIEETDEVIKTVNKIFGALGELGNRVNCAEDAKDWMEKSGFVDVQVWRVQWPLGAGAPQGEAFGKASADNVHDVVRGMWEKLLVNAPQLLPEEVRSEESGRAFLAEVKHAFYTKGSSAKLGMATGRKSG